MRNILDTTFILLDIVYELYNNEEVIEMSKLDIANKANHFSIGDNK